MEIFKHTVIYPGDISYFQASLERFEHQHRGIWCAENGEKLEFGFDPELQNPFKVIWFVKSYTQIADEKRDSPRGRATIIAFEDQPNQTLVEFIDGFHEFIPRFYGSRGVIFTSSKSKREDHMPIGSSFRQFVKVIKRECIVKSSIEKKSDITVAQSTSEENQPLDVIDDIADRELVRLWRDNTAQQITSLIGGKTQTVYNRISRLRKIFGDEIVPYKRHKKLR
jgi:hypothetical protein